MTKNILFSERKLFRIVYTILFSLVWLILYVHLKVEYIASIGYLSAVLLMAQAFWLVFRSCIARNILYTIFFLFIFLYTVPSKLFFFDGIYFSAHNQYFTYITATETTLIFALFLISVNAFMRVPESKEMKRLQFKNNSFVFKLLYIISFVIVLTSKRVGNMYNNSGDTVGMSVLNEYVIILFLILYIYSGNKSYRFILLSVLYTLYAMFAILSGGRIEVVLLLLFLLCVRFQYTFSFGKMIAFFVFGVWVMSIFGSIRQNPQLLLSGDITSVINPFASKAYFMNSQGSNEGDVYWASERMLVLIDKGELTVADRIEAGISYFLSAFVPSSWLSPLANLSNYKMDIETTGGGGLSPVFFYVMFGFGGVILLGFFIAKTLNQLSQNRSSVFYFYVYLMITMLARWFAYYPIHLIKLCLWGTLAYYLINCLDYTMRKHNKK